MTQFEGMDRTRFNQCIVEEGLNVDDFEITLKRDSPEVKRTDRDPRTNPHALVLLDHPNCPYS